LSTLSMAVHVSIQFAASLGLVVGFYEKRLCK
jgi:hypothetical protein